MTNAEGGTRFACDAPIPQAPFPSGKAKPVATDARRRPGFQTGKMRRGVSHDQSSAARRTSAFRDARQEHLGATAQARGKRRSRSRGAGRCPFPRQLEPNLPLLIGRWAVNRGGFHFVAERAQWRGSLDSFLAASTALPPFSKLW